MPRRDVVVSCPVPKSFNVKQVAGMFDLKLAKTAQQTFSVDIPAADEEWQIGVIVGPSGSGKSSVARDVYGDALYREDPNSWPAGQAVVDGFGYADMRDVSQILTAVGFSSPPSWVKPYHVLSNGERFRCDLARALLQDRPLVVVDEFTSVVDRVVARCGSAAVAKAIRSGAVQRKFVAVTCHYDVLEWLEADWVLDMATCELSWRRLRRPTIEIKIAKVHASAWDLFRRHHYLNTKLKKGSTCFVAFWDDVPVAFSAWTPRVTPDAKKRWQMREHRTVVLPDFQGLGIGNRLSEFCASIYTAVGGQAFSTTSHPAMIRHRSKSTKWKRHRLGMVSPPGKNSKANSSLRQTMSATRLTGGFKYVGPPCDRSLAQQILDAQPGVFRVSPSAAELLEVVRRFPGCSTALLRRKTGLRADLVRRYLADLCNADMAASRQLHRGTKRRVYYAAAAR